MNSFTTTRIADHAHAVRDTFLSGSSPTDFPEEHYERTWTDRFAIDDLNDIGRRGLGMTS
jgi:Protein of unknown function (DUF1479)